MSHQIKVISEVEKIWILYDLDNNGSLDFDEIKLYLQEYAYPMLNVTIEEIEKTFN